MLHAIRFGQRLRAGCRFAIAVSLVLGVAPITFALLTTTPAAASAANAIIPDADFGSPDFAQLPASDDGSTGFIPFGFNIDFGGHLYSGAYVNNNGNLTFTSALSSYTPSGLASLATPIIAPFFADVDTNVGGNPVEYGVATLDGYNVFVANWPGVDCYESNNSQNYFQVIIIDRPDIGTTAQGDAFQIEYNYDSVQWDAGQASGGDANCQSQTSGNSAVVGFSDGTPGGTYELPGSRENGALIDGGPDALITNDLKASLVATSGQSRSPRHRCPRRCQAVVKPDPLSQCLPEPL